MESEYKSVTQLDVAKEAGVTRSLVSYVITGNTDRSIAPETRKRILDAINKLGYRPNKAAQKVSQGRSYIAEKEIGVILYDTQIFHRQYYSELLSGIHSSAHDKGYNVQFIRYLDEIDNPTLFNEIITEDKIGSLILISADQNVRSPSDNPLIARIRERIKRIICIE